MRAFVVLALFGLAIAAPSVQQFINDNHVLNYALTLENFEAALYNQSSLFSDQQFIDAGFPANTGSTIRYIGSIESQHAKILTNMIQGRGWPAVQSCNGYNFTSVTTIQQYVAALALVEAVGTSAYDGAAQAITDKTTLTTAAGIATIEARHTALLNAIYNASQVGAYTPFLNEFDGSTAFNFTYVQSLIAPFFLGANCPTTNSYVAYLGTNYSVSSTNASSYQWRSANQVRGQEPFNYTLQANAGPNDLAVLNYALVLEHLEATFYSSFASLYSPANIEAAGVSASNASIISANIAAIAAHETAHVSFLSNTISELGGTPAQVCNYNTSILGINSTSTFAQFLATAALLENTGVTAYVGAIGYIVNSDFTSVAASIATVEAEHASYISNLLANVNNGFSNQPNPSVGNPVQFPAVTGTAINVAAGLLDGPTPPSQIQANIAQLLSCSTAQLGNPTPITATQFLNYFTDQGTPTFPIFSSSSTSATTSTNANPATTTAVNTNTKPTGSGAAIVASLAVVAAALMI